MRHLIAKEFRLAMHPVTPGMLLLSAMALIPNYPYTVIFFYVTMSLFFTCLSGRENNDITYSLNLPVEKRDVVRARFLFAVMVELSQLLVLIPFCLLSQRINPAGNQAGMDANLSLFSVGLLVYALFNLVFFTSYYKNVSRVGSSFLKSSVLLFLMAAVDAALTNAVPFFRDRLDGTDPAFLVERVVFLAVSALIFAACTLLSYRVSARRFETQDLN